MHQPSRRLAAILFTDIVGSTTMMQKDEQTAISVNKHYAAVLKKFVPIHGGEILNDYGDGNLCAFPSATEALRCAVEMQQQLQMEPKVPLRVGLHIGEIFFEDEKVFGDGVNVASRVQSLGISNSILFSSEIFSKIKNQQEFKSVTLGKFRFKNVDEPMEVFALANEGLVVPQKKQIEGKVHKSKSNKNIIIFTVILLMLAAVSFIGYYKYSKNNDFTRDIKSVAILPFKIFGNNRDNISEGLVEDILIRLSKIKELKVISNKSSARYADSKKSLKEIGEELGVNSLVMGSIQQVENTIRVTAQLIDCKTENTIWADNYNREIIKIFDLQAEVAVQVVNALKTKLTPDEKLALSKRYTDNVEAYKFYKKGRSFWDKRNRENFDSAEANYKRAILLDPDYALAYVGLADCYTINEQGLSQLEAVPIAREYVNKALAIDSTLSEALTTSAFISGIFDYEPRRCQDLLRNAIRLDPNFPTSHLYYGNTLLLIDEDAERGILETKIALKLDPLSLYINYILGRNYYHANKLDSAYLQLKKTLILNPGYSLAKAILAHVLLAKRNYSEAFRIINELPKTGPVNLQEYYGTLISYAYAVSGDISRAKKELENTLIENPKQLSYYFARNYAALKDFDKALTLLEKSYQLRELPLVFIKVDPTLNPLRGEPRFKEIMKKMHFD
jgi:TolB-like protein/class 3 adenylate cyclase/Tfp pilus assembly protein PilF